ncbi:hypothetical protein SEA_TEMPO_58 [Microbacterium phage Tempo]|nr:hypothetical protein SEA_TEMPO_58 [Microbacterium phage Tempo]
MERKTTITIGDTEYEAQLARVKETHLGYEDHGIFSLNIAFEGVHGSWGQGTGHRSIESPEAMFHWVKLLVAFFGSYAKWEDIAGKECFVLRESYSGPIVGLVSKVKDEALIFSEVDAQIVAAQEAKN